VGMRIKKVNVKRLASRTVLGAGALGAAEASSIVFSGSVDAHFGFCPRCNGAVTIGGLNGAGGIFFSLSFPSSLSGPSARFVNLNGQARCRRN